MPVQCTCRRCGVLFIRPGRRGGNFCSRPCAYQGRVKRPTAERFWEKVNKNGPVPTHRPELGPCWVWTASNNVHGYGKFFFNGRLRGAHIVSYILSTGHEPPTETPYILHHCDGGSIGCVRPSHLYAGTQADNMTDKGERGREVRGERRAKAKLTETAVKEIRIRYADGGTSHQKLAREYGVTRTAISQVLHGLTWTHV